MNNFIFFSLYDIGYEHALLSQIFIFAASKLQYIVIFGTLGFLIYKKVYLPKILLIYLTSIGAWVIAQVLKLLIHSDRPFVLLSNVSNTIPESGYSFPSGHATFFMALAVAVLFYHKKAAYVLMGCAVLIGIARVVVGVHFPGDILGGFALGALVAYFTHITVYSLIDHFFPPGGHH